jgi:predicted DNA-binding protein (MmcQ/YjbR family)
MGKVVRKTARNSSGADSLVRLRAICLTFPETTETTSWGHPNFRAGKKTFVTFEVHAGRPSIAFRLVADQVRDLCAEGQFFLTPYGKGLWASCYVDRRVSWRSVTHLAGESYRLVATQRMLKALAES